MDLHVKPSRMLYSKITKSNDLPPGFENNHHVNTKEEKLCRIPQIKWKCPPKFVMSSNWQIAAGEESEEVAVQKLREMRVLEAFYPHTSAIPTCPVVSSGIEDDGHDDRLTPVIPIIPIEEEEASEAPSTNIIPIRSLPPASPQAQLATKEASETTSQAKERTASGMSHGLGLNLITAAALAATTLKSNEIDTQLLIKIFSDPKMVEKLIKEYGGAANAGANATTTTTSKVSDPFTGRKQATQPISPVSAPTIVPKPAAQPIPLTGSKPDMVQPPNAKVGHFTNGMQLILSGPILLDTSAPAIVLKPAATQPIPLTSSKSDMVQPPNPKVGHFTSGTQPILLGPILPGNGNGMERPIMGNENSQKARKQVNVVPNLTPGRVQDPSLEIVKDANYYKNLIRLHGGESQESNIPFQDPKIQFRNQKLNTGELRTKKQKPCAYFNSSKGCRNGANCVFKHEMMTQKRGGVVMEPQNVKRMRIGGEIANRT